MTNQNSGPSHWPILSRECQARCAPPRNPKARRSRKAKKSSQKAQLDIYFIHLIPLSFTPSPVKLSVV